MTLDEAIKHSEEVADSYNNTVPDCDCAKEHRQLAEWLKELKRLREQTDEGPRGKWRSLDENTFICSECSQIYRLMFLPDYCPRCHAKMTNGLYEDMTEVN